jgi:GTP-binding protein LepA
VLEAVVKRVPPPKGDPSAAARPDLRRWYDAYRGVVVMMRLMDRLASARARRSA